MRGFPIRRAFTSRLEIDILPFLGVQHEELRQSPEFEKRNSKEKEESYRESKIY